MTSSSAYVRSNFGETLDVAQREPVTITNRGRRRAVVVSPDFFDRATEALEDLEDLRAAAAARTEAGETISHDELVPSLRLDLS